jgi:hypothetical protein
MFRRNDMVSLRCLQDSGDRRHLPFPFSSFAAEFFCPCSVRAQYLARLLFSVAFHSLLINPARCNRWKATNKEPALTRNTPLLTCSMRTATPYPCIASSANVFQNEHV